MSRSDDVPLVSRKEIGGDLETRHKATGAIASVPALGNLDGILLVAYGVEDRLFRETRWKATEPCLLDQLQLGQPHRSEKDDCIHRGEL